MAYQDVPTGKNPPDEVNLIIEIQKGGGQNKYEFDKTTGRLTLDRVNGTTGTYPADYGYVPGTLCEDGDPLDALLLIDEPVVHGAVVPARPIGVAYMVDDGENDEKLICVPRDDISHNHVKELTDIDLNFQKRVEQFYTHYKDWKNDWQGVKVEFKGWGDATAAKKVITESIERAKSGNA
ncbi:MAG TPA: inorganic diphosphatase [Candidatus Saccharimonadales bacterium]|jgi:inorganic pyrophosphatase|nr:inorganic diphosphatase [Candidatus Saccharimonadales bacterium]